MFKKNSVGMLAVVLGFALFAGLSLPSKAYAFCMNECDTYCNGDPGCYSQCISQLCMGLDPDPFQFAPSPVQCPPSQCLTRSGCQPIMPYIRGCDDAYDDCSKQCALQNSAG